MSIINRAWAQWISAEKKETEEKKQKTKQPLRKSEKIEDFITSGKSEGFLLSKLIELDS